MTTPEVYLSSKQRHALVEKLSEQGHKRVFPLSAAQSRLWILDRFQPGNPTYNIPASTPLQGWIDTDALERSLNEIVRRHEVLRTVFEVRGGKPVQVIMPSLHINLEIIDLNHVPKRTRDIEVNRIILEESRWSFDLAKGPLFRASLLRLDRLNNILVLVMHHIVSDGWSMSVLYQELSTLYMAYVSGQEFSLPDLPIQYADFVQWQSELFRSEVLQKQLHYWKKQLAGLRPVSDLPTDYPRPTIQTNRGDIRLFTINHQLCEELKMLSRSYNATLFMTLLAAFKILLYRLGGETDIAVGSPIANRKRTELEGLIGFFVNTLVLRTDLSGNPSFLELLKREREVTLGAYENQDLPFEKLVEELQPDRNLAHNPLFQILFAVQNFGIVDSQAAVSRPAESQAPVVGNGTAKFDLTMSLMDTGAGAQGCLEFNLDLFSAATIEIMIKRYLILLDSIVKYPEWRLSELPISNVTERKHYSVGWSGEKINIPLIETVGEVLAARAIISKDATAVVFNKVELRYAELNQQANRIAHRLHAIGAKLGSPIAILMTRSLDALVMIAGILKAGCIYIPIDPSEPMAKVERILKESQPMFVVIDEDIQSRGISCSVDAIKFHEIQSEADQESDVEVETNITPDSIGSIIYRANPDDTLEEIPITHRSLCRSGYDESIRLNESDCIAYLSHAASDRARYEIFGAFVGGATIKCIVQRSLASPRKFSSMLRNLDITALFIPLSMIERLAREFPWSLRKIRLLLNDERIGDWKAIQGALKPEIIERIYCLYGDPSAGGYFLVQPLKWVSPIAPVVPMGNPIPNETVYLLDVNLDPVPSGIPGEVYVESDLVISEADHLSNSIIPSSNGDKKLYRTGDIARRLQDGTFEWQGRRDEQLFYCGVVVYASAIEAVLYKHPNIHDAAVAQRRRRGLYDRGLVAFVQTTGTDVTGAELDDFLAEQFQEATIPIAFSTIDTIPRMADGSLDRRKLADLSTAFDAPKNVQELYVEPRNELETTLTQIWMETLGSDRIGINDNFFRLGGHSLLATQAIARISDTFHIDLPLERLFNSPTIQQLAKVIEPLISEECKSETPPIRKIPRDQPIPLSFAQQRLWFLDQFEPDSAFYNIAIPVHWNNSVDASSLEAALNDLIERHEPLRTSFTVSEEEPLQIIAPSLKISMPVHDLRRWPTAERQAEAQRLIAIEAQKPFNLRTGPVLRAELICLSDREYFFLFTIHHIAADGWSTEIIFRELMQYYEARLRGRVAELPELRVQYADFACWQRKWLTGAVFERQISYWKRQLDGAPPLLELPADRPRPLVQMFSGGICTFSISNSLLESAKRLSEQEQTTLFTTLLSTFYVLLYRHTGRKDLVVGSPIANRVRPEFESLIGFFANTLVLRTQLSGVLTFRQLIARVREVTLGAYAYQDIPFEKLVEELKPERNLAYNPIFQVMFALQNIGRPAMVATEEPDNATPVIGAGVAKFDLTMFVSETINSLQVGIEYNFDLFDASRIARFAMHYEALLAAATINPDCPIWALQMLSPDENMSLVEWNDTAGPFERECIHHMFELQASRTPEEAAVIFNDKKVSYQELNRRSNCWAHRLIEFGVKSDTCVGIFMNRSEDLIVAVLAVLKAGAAYVPIDPNYPKERIKFMLRDSCALMVLTQMEVHDLLPTTEARILSIDSDEFDQANDENPVTGVSSDNLAYILYTSGSTGTPKGVAMPHTSVTNLIQWQIARSALPEGSRTLQLASLSFDVSFQEIFSTLCAGGSLVLVTEKQKRDPQILWNILHSARINRLFLPYVALQQLAEEAKKIDELPLSLTEIITAGEQLQITPQISMLFERLNTTSLYNQYGPTESHVVTELKLLGLPSEWPIKPSIGRPLTNTTIHILDEFGQSCAIGTLGELYIGGIALARGYYRREDLTADRFVVDSQGSKGERLYRTGDRACFLADGNVQFLGRMDDQVKIRGFRVEPGEVEMALRMFDSIQEAAVVARAQERTGDLQLVAYVQADPQNAPTSHQLRAHLLAMLPEYMIPSIFVVIKALPLTPTGKLNRRALPKPDLSQTDLTTTITPRTPIEHTLARIWQDVLDLDHVGISDNFFELGGHSLLATRVISRLHEEFGIELPVHRIFDAPTIEALAITIVESSLRAHGDDEMAHLLAELEAMPDEEVQRRYQEIPRE